MPSAKQLRKAAKDAGLSGYSKLNKDRLAEFLAENGVSVDASEEASPKNGYAPIGVPNEPAKAGLSDDDMAALLEAGKVSGGQTVDPKIGYPTEPERGGVTEKDIQVLTGEPIEQPKPAKPGPAPSITGADISTGVGVPTEAKRGGLNKRERKLQGAK